eukprot:356133-Chlamydomonas_euryale.AAC.25
MSTESSGAGAAAAVRHAASHGRATGAALPPLPPLPSRGKSCGRGMALRVSRKVPGTFAIGMPQSSAQTARLDLSRVHPLSRVGVLDMSCSPSEILRLGMSYVSKLPPSMAGSGETKPQLGSAAGF